MNAGEAFTVIACCIWAVSMLTLWIAFSPWWKRFERKHFPPGDDPRFGWGGEIR